MTEKIREQIQDLRWRAEDYAYLGDNVMYTSWADTMQAMADENEQHIEIRADMERELASIAEKLGVPDEPHQTWSERLHAKLGATLDVVEAVKAHVAEWDDADAELAKALAKLEEL